MSNEALSEDLVLRVYVQPASFRLNVDRANWAAMTEDERLVEVYEAAEEFDRIRVTYQEPIAP